MPEARNLVLVHGGWHDASAWTETISHLRTLGIANTWAPTLLGHGPHTPRAVTHKQIVVDLTEWIEAHDLWDVTLVAHSFSGWIIPGVAELIPGRIARTVFISTFVPQHGLSFQDDLADAEPAVDLAQLYHAEDNTMVMSWDAWLKFAHDASDPVARAAFARLWPEGLAPLAERVDLPEFHQGLKIPQSVITLEDDHLMPWADYAARLTRVDRRLSIPGSHEVMFAAPERLAEAIVAAAYGEHAALPETEGATASA